MASRRYQSTHAIDGPMGFGWISSVSARLYYATYLFAAPSTYQKEADVRMPDGSQYRFIDNGNGTFTPPQGRHDTLVRNADGTFDLTLQRTRSVLHFDALGGLLSLTDDYGNALNVTYDGNGRVQRIADMAGSGRYLDAFWGADGRISAVRDSGGRQVQYAYNGQGALATVTDSASRVTSYTYVTGRFAPLLSQIKDNWNRLISTITYDTTDRVKTYTDRGETYTYTYAYQGNPVVTSKTDSAGNTFIYPFGSSGLVSDTTPPSGGGGPTHTDYYPDGSIQQFTDAVGVKTFYTYTADGNLLTITRDYQGPTTVRFDYAYDPSFPSKVTSITPKNPSTNVVDPNWQAWQYDYYQTGDPAPGALHHVYRVENDGATLDTLATYQYDARGRAIRQTSATGGATDYLYDANGNLQSVTGPANNDAGTRPVRTYGYDSLGRVNSVTDPLNHAASYAYDALDRVTGVTLPKPSSSSTLNFTTAYGYDNYDSGTSLLSVNVTDPNGQITKQAYDQFGRLVRSYDDLGRYTLYGYTRGLLSSITDANGNVTSYGYDSGRRLTSTTSPDSAVERYSYTADNRLYQKVDRRNQAITYAYDHLKRLSSKGYPTSSSIAYTYQGQKLAQVVDTSVSPTETHTFAYDSSYRLSSETQASRGTVSHLYNLDDTVATMMVQNGPATAYTYYADGSLNTIAWSPVSGVFKYTYTLVGQYQAIAFPNGQSRNFSYDDQSRLTRLTNLTSGGTNVATYGYAYDLNYTTGLYTMLGQWVSMTATVPSQGLSNHTTTYEYDPNYQLVKATYPNVTPFNGEVDSWTYDAIGNRLTNTVNGATTNYTYQKIAGNPNNWQRLTNDGPNAYTYDANGSTVTRAAYSFAWDYENRMSSISGGTTSSYRYDSQGRRSQKTVSGTTSSYLYNGLNLIQETAASQANYLFGPRIDEPLALSRGSQIYYYVGDAIGSITAIADASGNVQNSYLYDGWGRTRSQAATIPNPFSYSAREQGDTEQLFYRARHYNPDTGSFLSEDPLIPTRRTITADLYRFVRNSPVMYRDPLGLTCQTTTAPGPSEILWSVIWRSPWHLAGGQNSSAGPDRGPPGPFVEPPIGMPGGSQKPGFGWPGGPSNYCTWRREVMDTIDWLHVTYVIECCDCPPGCRAYNDYSNQLQTVLLGYEYTQNVSGEGLLYPIFCNDYPPGPNDPPGWRRPDPRLW
jgi:RHS repeat-associated protein